MSIPPARVHRVQRSISGVYMAVWIFAVHYVPWVSGSYLSELRYECLSYVRVCVCLVGVVLVVQEVETVILLGRVKALRLTFRTGSKFMGDTPSPAVNHLVKVIASFVICFSVYQEQWTVVFLHCV